MDDFVGHCMLETGFDLANSGVIKSPPERKWKIAPGGRKALRPLHSGCDFFSDMDHIHNGITDTMLRYAKGGSRNLLSCTREKYPVTVRQLNCVMTKLFPI